MPVLLRALVDDEEEEDEGLVRPLLTVPVIGRVIVRACGLGLALDSSADDEVADKSEEAFGLLGGRRPGW